MRRQVLLFLVVLSLTVARVSLVGRAASSRPNFPPGNAKPTVGIGR
jgi:hypothetical protein